MSTVNCPVPSIIGRIQDLIELIFGSDVEIKVDPANLRDAAQETDNKIRTARGYIEAIEHTMNNMNSYWSGNVFDERIDSFRRKIINLNGMLDAMSVYSEKLKAIAQTYINAEEDNKEKAEALPVNVIS